MQLKACCTGLSCAKKPSFTRTCNGVDAECPSLSVPVRRSSTFSSLFGIPETVITLGSKCSQFGSLPSRPERLKVKMSPSGSVIEDRGSPSVNSWPAVAVIPGKLLVMKGLPAPEPTFSTKPVLAERPDVECVPFSVMPSSVSWEGVPVNDFRSGSNLSQLGNGDPSVKEALKLTPSAPDVTASGTWNPNGLATSALWSGTNPRARGFKDSPIPDASEETPPLSFPEPLLIPGFPAKPERVPVPEIADVATPQLSTSAWKHICVAAPSYPEWLSVSIVQFKNLYTNYMYKHRLLMHNFALGTWFTDIYCIFYKCKYQLNSTNQSVVASHSGTHKLNLKRKHQYMKRKT